ncbi:flagellar filament capping protein FliD [Methylomarinum vadi]|uniref:flagellar filament capping protein FliD n=1 Tax=Methylomarinum vadi TaxID=438855 RepID=UPI0004DEDCF7|nr:flagellar filament capping protein FliD [Methylomarinum vadi]
MAGGVTSLGLGSGIDVRSIVDGLVAAERQPQEFQLTKQESDIQSKLSSYGIFKSALSDFRSSLAGLRDSGKFEALQAKTSQSDVISASVSSNAETGHFNLESKQLAQAQSLVSAGFADANATVGTGTLTIKFGATDYDPDTDAYNGFNQNPEKGTLTLTLDGSNNTLTGMRDAINEANAGVNASIVYDGSAYRLVLASEKTGAANSMQITVDDPSLSQFEFNETATSMEQTQVAQDSILSINGLDVTSATNTFNDTLKGISLDLAQAQPGETISLDISHSTEGVVDSLQGFVDSFNELASSVKDLTSYDPQTQSGSALLGDATLRSGMSQIRSVLGSLVSGLEGTSIRTLVDLGITTQADGTLKFDSGKLTEALKSDPDGVAAVFTQIGRPSNDNVAFFSNTGDTQTGNYAVNVTQAATQALLSGATNSVNSLTVTAGVNDTFKINVDGSLSSAITLSAGVYANANELAAEIQAQINGNETLRNQGAKVTVSYDGANNRMMIASQTFGSGSQVEITESNASDLGLAVAAGVDGTDVAGTIGGIAAEGDGQYLTATNGLKLFVDGGVSGDLGSVNFSRGLMEKLDSVLGGLLDSDGSLTAKTEGLQKSLDQINDERLDLNDKIAKYEERLLSRFNAMDAMLGQIQSTGSFLSQQLASLPYNNISKK